MEMYGKRKESVCESKYLAELLHVDILSKIKKPVLDL